MFIVNPEHVCCENTLSGERGIKKKKIFIISIDGKKRIKSKPNSLADHRPQCVGIFFYLSLLEKITSIFLE